MSQASAVRTIKVPEVGPDDDPYVLLVQAIVARAVSDALGYTSPARHIPRAQLQCEALEWLAEEDAVVELLELAGFDAEPIVRLVQHCLSTEVSHGT